MKYLSNPCLLVCLLLSYSILSTAHPGAVTLLLKYGARVDIQNADGSTPLHVAVANGVPLEIVHSLVKVGSALGKKDNKGNYSMNGVYRTREG